MMSPQFAGYQLKFPKTNENWFKDTEKKVAIGFQAPSIQDAFNSGALKDKEVEITVHTHLGPRKPLVRLDATISQNGEKTGTFSLYQEDKERAFEGGIKYVADTAHAFYNQGFRGIVNAWNRYKEDWLHVKSESLEGFLSRFTQSLQDHVSK
jgi:hypothetical protein